MMKSSSNDGKGSLNYFILLAFFYFIFRMKHIYNIQLCHQHRMDGIVLGDDLDRTGVYYLTILMRIRNEYTT